ncbi:hypothetical protein LEMLEM_LOCUS24611, partial [Lemmus lemmus]
REIPRALLPDRRSARLGRVAGALGAQAPLFPSPGLGIVPTTQRTHPLLPTPITASRREATGFSLLRVKKQTRFQVESRLEEGAGVPVTSSTALSQQLVLPVFAS